MSKQRFLSPDRLYERPFSAAHPFVRSPSPRRRWIMLSIFFVLCAIIGTYLFITDAKRVKRMAESELSRVLGGRVTVEKAKLSIFEGLRLENVQVYIDDNPNKEDPQARLFSAATFLVSYDAKALLTGELKLTQIIAIDPHVQLVEDLDTGRWNYQRMMSGASTPSSQTTSANVPVLPAIVLRNAKIDYSEIRAGEPVSGGSMTIEGQLAPISNGDKYSFELQSRGGDSRRGSTTLGPTVSGMLVRSTGLVTAQLRDFQFGQDIRSMLPAEVRSWWDRHELTGAVDVPVLTYSPPHDGEDAKFKVETDLHGVNLTVRPEEWMSRDELETHEMAAGAFASMGAAGLDSNGVVSAMAKLVQPSPLQLGRVDGRFVFTEKGITLGQFDEGGKLSRPVAGSLEKNEFAIDGRIDGYSPQAPATVHLASQQIQIPKTPRYITSMPRVVRELYEHLRPEGTATMDVNVTRPTGGGRLDVAGVIGIINGNFMFDRFPYPARNASGRVAIGYDPHTGADQVKIDVKCNGAAGGPNENSVVRINGRVSPLNGDPHVEIKIACDDMQEEPALYKAFPAEVKQTLRNMDAEGKGLFPTFKGGFECRVNRPEGLHQPWLIDTDVTLKDAAGKMVVFPYFMEHVTGKLAIREGYMDVIAATMKRGDSSLVMDGRVTWRAGAGSPLEAGQVLGEHTSPRPDLKITARNVPIDQALLDALPADRREWMQKAGLKGTIDIDGRVWHPNAAEAATLPPSPDGSPLTHAFDITLRDGSIWPIDGGSVVSAVAAKLHLLPDRMVITDFLGKRGDGDLTGHGEVSWPQNKPSVFFSGTASKLKLDSTLYKVLPAVAQKAWDSVKPEGVVDLDLSYRGAVVEEASGPIASQAMASASGSIEPMGVAPATKPSIPDLDLIIHPRTLAVTVQAVPYRLDNVTGTVRVKENRVALTDIAAQHGPASVHVSGVGMVADQSQWELRLSGNNVVIDNDFRKALPPAMLHLCDSLKVGGLLAFDFSKLAIQTSPNLHPTKLLPDPTIVDMDFGTKVWMNNASFDVGMPMTQVRGTMELSGTVRNSKLAAFEGPIDLPTLNIAGRAARDVHAEFYKPADQDGLRVGKISGRLADGDIAGQVDLTFPDVGTNRYAMDFVMRNADVRQLSGDAAPDLTGEISASLSLQGDWSDIRTRRGRGDVLVSGKEMYKIPLILGLLQITNLSLPITSPFNDASARYTVTGEVVTFETLELRSHDMMMTGAGQLNFNTKKVAMTFTTDNPNWPKLPIIGDIVQTAKHELLQIHVKGTLQDNTAPTTAPSTQPVNTVNTTVDDVQRSGPGMPQPAGKK